MIEQKTTKKKKVVSYSEHSEAIKDAAERAAELSDERQTDIYDMIEDTDEQIPQTEAGGQGEVPAAENPFIAKARKAEQDSASPQASELLGKLPPVPGATIGRTDTSLEELGENLLGPRKRPERLPDKPASKEIHDAALAGITISDLKRDEQGHWTCKLTVNQETFPCERRGGWAIHDGSDIRQMLPHVAAVIQSYVRTIEASDRKNPQNEKEQHAPSNRQTTDEAGSIPQGAGI